jgi:hypothetical protein
MASPAATDMVELRPGKDIEISPDQIKDVKGISGQSISGEQPGTRYYKATGPVKVPQSFVIGSSTAKVSPGATGGGKEADRSKCIVLNSVQ